MGVCRRVIWSFFRVGREHVSNSQGFRRADLVPMHFQKQSTRRPSSSANGRTFRLVIAEAVAMVVGGFGIVIIALGVKAH